MQSRVTTHLFTLTLVCLGTASCAVQSRTQSSSMPTTALSQQSSHTSTGTSSPRPFEQYVEEIRTNLYQEKFALLDTVASQLRAGKDRFRGGAWKLNAFYTGLDQPFSGDNASESEWQMHLNKLRKWVSQSSDSITAHVALGDALVEYAWNARGQGYANTVTPEGARLFKERSELAEKVLNDAKKLSSTCPHWYVAMLRVGLGGGWEPSRFNRLFDEAVALEPTYYYFYRVKAMYLLPRWYGESGDWEKFADEASQKVGGKQGAMLYYLIASHIRIYYGRSFFAENQVSWPKIKDGFNSLEELYGTDSERLKDICRLAAMAADRGYARCFSG